MANKPRLVVTICSSLSFYAQAIEIQEQLESLGCKVIIPFTAERMKKTGDFNADHYKTWFADAADYHKKTKLMRGHFSEVKKGDVTLVLNYEKHGAPNYIGGNVLMEMAVAFFLQKPIFILNDVPSDSPFLEEILGMNPILLHGSVKDLPAKAKVLK